MAELKDLWVPSQVEYSNVRFYEFGPIRFIINSNVSFYTSRENHLMKIPLLLGKIKELRAANI